MITYKPTRNRLLIRQEKEEVSTGGILIAYQSREANRVGEIQACWDDSVFCEGDKVIFDLSAGTIIEDTDTYKLLIVDEDDILALVTDIEEEKQ